jgi:cytochrome c oxidase assembly protein Cox11
MLGFSYASVPLYQLYCQATGLGGISVLAEKSMDQVDLSPKGPLEKTEQLSGERAITVEFNSETSDNMP